MILAAHNPEFADDCSITELLSRIAILSSQLDSADKQIVDLISQNADLAKQKTETEEQFAREKTALLQHIEKLERSAALDSNNSCKPPSSDGLRKSSGKKDKEKKKWTKSLRNSSGRKSGGQPGHKGNTLKQVDNPDEIIDILPEQCPNCETEFSLEDSTGFIRRQVIDLPPPVVTEHRGHTCKCIGCGDEFKGEFPADVTAPVQYGKTVASFAAYYQTVHVIPVNRLVRVLNDMHQMKLSEATLMKMIGDMARRLGPVADLLQKKIAGNPLVTTHLDETGFRAEDKFRWIHTTSSETMSHFRVGSSRGDILFDLAGNIVHDCFAVPPVGKSRVSSMESANFIQRGS